MSLLLLASFARAANLVAGTPIEITDISPEDAYIGQKDSIVGQRCSVGAGGLTERRPGWHGGSVTCSDTGYFFFEVGVEVIGAPEPTASAADHGSVVRSGTRFRIADIHPDDAYHGDRSTYVGRTCTATGDLNAMAPGWYAGPADCEGQSMYFFKAALTAVEASSGAPGGGSAGPGGWPTADAQAAPMGFGTDLGPTVAAGTKFRIADIHPEDAFHSDRGQYLGLACTVAPTGLTAHEAGWYSGAASCEGGFEPYFYKVAITVGGTGERVFTAPKLSKGIAVRVVSAPGLSPALSGVIGEVCVTASTLKQVAPGVYAGRLACEGLKLKIAGATLERP